jgi:hypothetical protein
MAKEILSGISFSGMTAIIAVLEKHKDAHQLVHLDEIEMSGEKALWFLDALDTVEKKLLGKIDSVSVALENARVQLHAFPTDSSLTRVEQNEHVRWELAQYVENFRPSEYVTDLHILRSNAREQVTDVLAVSVPQSLVFNIETNLSARKLNLKTVMVGHFAAEEALRLSHPELKNETCVFIEISNGRVDLEILKNEKRAGYGYTQFETPAETVGWMNELILAYPQAPIYLHGTEKLHEWIKLLRGSTGREVTTLNPFRKIRISPSVAQFSRQIGKEHRFAACIGAAVGAE